MRLVARSGGRFEGGGRRPPEAKTPDQARDPRPIGDRRGCFMRAAIASPPFHPAVWLRIDGRPK
jgi:hypothetical protein